MLTAMLILSILVKAGIIKEGSPLHPEAIKRLLKRTKGQFAAQAQRVR